MADKKYFQPVETAQSIQDFYGGKNLININYYNRVYNGVNIYVDYDAGTITCNGTATAKVTLFLDVDGVKAGKEYILSGTPSEGSEYSCLRYMDNADVGNGVKFIPQGNPLSYARLDIEKGTTVSNMVFRPMLRLANGTSNEFISYSPTNRVLYNMMSDNPGKVYCRDITSRLNTTLYDEINNGDFRNIKPGDIIHGPVTGAYYWIAHRDPWYGYDDIGLKTIHHVILLAVNYLASGKMNDTNTTSGGYIASKGKETVDQLIQDYFVKDFGSHIKQFKNLQVNATGTDGVPTGWQWYDTYGDLMSEVNVYGTTVWSNSGFNTGIQKEQFEIFRDLGTHILGATNNWLKDVTSPLYFAFAYDSGRAGTSSASHSYGFRPFAVLAA